ncbi:MAG: 4-hydroxy-2-oxovalerate aldolase [Deltaproteobacteria bacterium]|nr:4-hydroxy-2-oxovalerate aldolase [Deltaproteobacteria bacterium]
MTLTELTTRRKAFKSRLSAREEVFGAWTSIGHPQITEAFTRADVDFVGIDVEHSTISQEQVQRIIAAAQAGGSLCLPRVASHNCEAIRRMLDSGADGIIVPTVDTVDQVEAIVSWAKYPPAGSRGFGVARAQGYGFDFDEYTSDWNDSSSLIVQIESVIGVENADEIASHPQVDGVIVGPYDISGSLGIPGRIDDPLVREAAAKVVETCRRYGKACGTQIVEPDAANVARAFEDGFSIILLASDVFLLWKWSERMADIVKGTREA